MRPMRKALLVACMLSLMALPAASQRRGGIQADLAAAAGAVHTQEAAQATATAADSDALRVRLARNTRALYRLTRAGMAPVAGGLAAVRGHVARIERLKRLLQADLHTLQTRDQAPDVAYEAGARPAAVAAQPAMSTTAALETVEAQAEVQQGDDTRFYGLRVHGDAPAQEGFAAQRGRLASPVTGEVVVQDARRAESDGAGLEFHVPAGTPVRAVSAGRVAFSDVYGNYGRLVILDHGDGYYTVYGGLGRVEVRVGDDLSRRARLGNVGTDQSGSALYFEVRKGTRALPPRAWIGL